MGTWCKIVFKGKTARLRMSKRAGTLSPLTVQPPRGVCVVCGMTEPLSGCILWLGDGPTCFTHDLRCISKSCLEHIYSANPPPWAFGSDQVDMCGQRAKFEGSRFACTKVGTPRGYKMYAISD